MADSPLQLNYGTQPPSYRRWLRLFAVLAIVAATVAGIYMARARVHLWLAERRYAKESAVWYAKALTNTEPATVLKYSENPADAPAGGFISSVSGVHFGVFQDPYIDRLPMFYGAGEPLLADRFTVVFAHERTNAAGLKRLIMVDFGHWSGNQIWFSTYQICPMPSGPRAGAISNLRSNGTNVNMTGFATPGTLRLYAGQIDPNDPARFWIPFESNGKHGRINGSFIVGSSSSADPASQKIEQEMNSIVTWTVSLDNPTTATSRASEN